MLSLKQIAHRISGIGLVNDAFIWGEIGNISCFSNAAKLAANTGIDASVSQ